MAENGAVPPRNAATAVSFAALSAAGAPFPRMSASRARDGAGNTSGSTLLNLSSEAASSSSLSPFAAPSSGSGQRSGWERA